ncbi:MULTISPECIES: CYTH domain-containing protein [Prochlorococcus]|uniref:CYTH domain-containing protein n=1 Tax=Prochlorococcus TaxID=1218 RepID=UPI000533B95B|nr:MULTISPECIES: CYTH domain-containing protein [Prochlorococcus]KGG13218.1 hypothetical protein EV05_0897 [Prochlorococcus sp. MIT 0601]
MPIEIERRFLVQGEDWKELTTQSEDIRQGYLATNFSEWITRIRIINNKNAILTLKNSLPGIETLEFEYSVPIDDAETMWKHLKHKVAKQRYYLDLQPGIWVVDCFKEKNAPLIIAEVELETTTSKICPPPWCRKELTGLRRYSNAALAKTPFANWPTKEPNT